ncbi:PH domain-containing protein [Algibacter sp. 2305UL17-15]|uniref:PH domain-containing protein n=1 Tax=Algibacter sp. 2305UL17-15 TaxID=3231268 RepID=UPI003459DCE2
MKVYKSKISYGFLLGVFIFFGIISYFNIFSNDSSLRGVIIVSLIHLLPLLFLIYTFYNTDYTIENNTLKIRSGFIFKKNLEIDKITSVSKTNSLLSSPAASLTDRIELKFGEYNSIIVSPKEKMEFIEELLSVNPNIINNLKA